MNILGGLHQFISSLPAFEGKVLLIDYLGNIKDSYSIERTAEPQVIKKYTDGGRLMEYEFSVSSRRIYPEQSEETKDFFEQLSAQIKKKSDDNILPELGTNATAVEIKVLHNGIRKTNDLNTARYSASFRLIYYVN